MLALDQVGVLAEMYLWAKPGAVEFYKFFCMIE